MIPQWKQKGLRGGPLVRVRFHDGRHDVTISTPGGPDPDSDRKRSGLPDIRFGDVVVHARFSHGDDGLVEM